MRYVLAALIGVAFSAPASADSLEDVRSFNLVVTGTIADHCTLGRIDNVHFPDLTAIGSQREFKVDLDCNLPFSIGVKAEKGAISHVELPEGQGPFSGRVPYAIGVEFATRHPAPAYVSKTFEGRNLTDWQFVSSRGGIASEGMRLTLALGQPSGEAGLLGGDYAERIEITVRPE